MFIFLRGRKMISEKPYDNTTHNNPWLININKDEIISGPNGNKLTAGYIWEKCGKEREDLVHWVFNYYRQKGFISSPLSDVELREKFKNLINKKPLVVDKNGFINNSSSLCNDVCRHFTWEKFFAAKGNTKTISIYDIFHNDELFLQVLKNRMGYCITREDGTERPYVFAITDKMILQGIRSTGLGYSVSLFKPIIGKYLYNKYAIKKVFDYSAGWGARCLAAMSLGLEYYASDPLTAGNVNKMIEFYGGSGFVVDGGSEDAETYEKIPIVDCVLSCPPYFDLEIYSEDEKQSIVKYDLYENWINQYWHNTVKNCLEILSENGYFVLIIKDMVGKYNIGKDMTDICLKHKIKLIETIYYKTSTNHLSGKAKTGKKSKNNEMVCIFSKNSV
jgi:hypothetical protein